MKSKVVITGSAGFVGKHLAEYLEANQYEVIGFNLRDGQDILDYESVRNVLDIHRPKYIFHLAAQAYVPESVANPPRTFQINTIGSLNVLEAVRQLGIKSKVLLAGTSEEYGDAQYGTGRITEEASPNPLSPYAISKLAMDHLGQFYASTYRLPIVVTRAFNHTGPGRGEMYADSSFAKQIAEVEAGKREYVEHGNLESVRNYSDVRDIVRAYAAAIELEPGVYNICSNQNVTMQQVLDTLIYISGRIIETRVNSALWRPNDFSFKKPSCKKFTTLTEWKPEIKLRKTLRDLLVYWQERV